MMSNSPNPSQAKVLEQMEKDRAARKRRNRDNVLSQIEAKVGMIKVLRGEAQRLAEGLAEEWVVRCTVVTQRTGAWGTGAPAGSQSYLGVKNPGTKFMSEGFVYSDPTAEGVRVAKTPDSAKLYAQCAADKDRGFDRQAWYIIEVVDRVDGEVFCQIDSRSEYIKAVDRGERDSTVLRRLLNPSEP